MRIFRLACLLFLLGLYGQLLAQQSYVEASSSYAFGIHRNLDTRFVNSKFSFAPFINRYILRADQQGASLASGLHVQVAGGYDFPNNFGLAAELGWLFSQSQQWTAEENSANLIASEGITGNVLDMALLLRFRLGDGLVIPYMAMGPSLAIPFFERTVLVTENGAELLQERWEYTRNPAFGFRAKLGVRVHLNNYAEFFFEGQFEAMAFQPRAEYLRLYEENNNDLLATRSIAQANILYRSEFEQEFVLGPNGERIQVIDQNQPMFEERITIPLHRLHIRLGYRRFLRR